MFMATIVLVSNIAIGTVTIEARIGPYKTYGFCMAAAVGYTKGMTEKKWKIESLKCQKEREI